MQPAALKALEFDRVREVLAREALTPFGRERVLALEPSGDADVVRERLALTVEAVAFDRDGGSLGVSAPDQLPHTLDVLGVADQPVEPLALLGLAGFLDSVDDVIGGIVRAAAGGDASLRRLREIALRASSFADESSRVRRAIHPTGEISDDASPALREIREALRRNRAKLRTTLEALTRGRDAAKYLQDQIITDRHGRYVVVVRAEHKDALPGIVHGSSGSGASLFLEPLATVELNNDIVALAGRERDEIHRILLALSDAFRQRGEELDETILVVSELDGLHAAARLAQRLDGVAPALTPHSGGDARIEFRDARHPLLVLAPPASEGQPRPAVVVGTDLIIVPPASALVISGPNTGGKTVALKAAGLLALMAQSGLLIPVAAGSRFTPFASVFADIGDDQSIAASLSTFSARIANIVAMERALALPALVLLDEVGSGTDPVEGGALGTAIIDHFRRRGALVVATTHDDALKSYAATTDGVTTAAFGFDPDSYAPTYRLLYGAPGRSLALEIAERLGMPADVIAAARTRRSGRESLLAEHLARVDRELAVIERERGQLARDRDTFTAERQRVLEREARLAEREAILKKRLDERLNEKIREARHEVDRIVGQLKMKADALAARSAGRGPAGPGGPGVSTGDLGSLRAEARGALAAVGAGLGHETPDEMPARLTAPPAIGDRVVIATLGTDAIVRGVSGQRVDVEVRGKRMRVALDDLAASRPEKSDAARGPAGGNVTRPLASDRSGTAGLSSTTRELVVIGSTVDEAVDRLEKFLDAALLADERHLRIVHGHGTGRLREAVRAFFRQHPLVGTVTAAADNQGGDGATMVELKD